MANICYFSIHSVLEYDEVKLLTELGHSVFSLGVYQNSNKGSELRGEIPGLFQDTRLQNIALQCSKENIHSEIAEFANIFIIMHTPPVSSPPFFPWIANNWSKFGNKPVIWRSIGQNIAHLEEELSTYRDRGLKIVRYSSKERTIPNYAGEDAVIRFYKDPEEYKNWTGEKKTLINFTQSLKQRGDHCGYNAFMEVSKGFDRKVYGVGNEELGDLWGGQLSHDNLKKTMRENRVYFYYGTAPASYTLGLMEAMMTGIPVVAAGPGFTKKLYPEQDTNEIAEIIENGVSGFVSDDVGQLRKYVKDLMQDDKLAKRISEGGRKRAIELFGKDKIKGEWETFLNEIHTRK